MDGIKGRERAEGDDQEGEGALFEDRGRGKEASRKERDKGQHSEKQASWLNSEGRGRADFWQQKKRRCGEEREGSRRGGKKEARGHRQAEGNANQRKTSQHRYLTRTS